MEGATNPVSHGGLHGLQCSLHQSLLPRSTFERFKCKNYLNKLAFSSGNADMDEGTILKTERERVNKCQREREMVRKRV